MIYGLNIHIPEGINFECTGCGNCCYGWPVPVTGDDVERITPLKARLVQAAAPPSFRELPAESGKLSSFTHTLEKRNDGKCEFLMLDNRCALHDKFGASAKPSMCQLFPFTFTDTPSGFYLSASFASTGVLLNSGRALVEQKEGMLEMLNLFKRLFPSLKPDWMKSQLIDGTPLTWSDYLELEERFLPILSPASRTSLHVDEALKKAVAVVAPTVPAAVNIDELAPVEARPKVVDQLLLKFLFDAYFPADEYASNKCELDAEALARALVKPPDKVEFSAQGEKFQMRDLTSSTLGALDDQTENLLLRFAYCRIFAKLYFGAGFQDLSLLAGLCHLSFLIAMVRSILKVRKERRKQVPDFLEAAELVRALERRLTVASFSRGARSILEVLIVSPQRLERVFSLSR